MPGNITSVTVLKPKFEGVVFYVQNNAGCILNPVQIKTILETGFDNEDRPVFERVTDRSEQGVVKGFEIRPYRENFTKKST